MEQHAKVLTDPRHGFAETGITGRQLQAAITRSVNADFEAGRIGVGRFSGRVDVRGYSVVYRGFAAGPLDIRINTAFIPGR